MLGVFNDSLPDGWGRLLLDRKLISKGISLNAVTPLDRLAYVGETGKGVLIYTPDLSENETPDFKLELGYLADEMTVVLKGVPILKQKNVS